MKDQSFLALLVFLLLLSHENGVNGYIRKKNKYLCSSPPVTRHDALGRRRSGYLVPPGNQGSCGSCWAFAGSHTFSDTINLKSRRFSAWFSPDHVAQCSPYSGEGNGCCGGSVESSAKYFQEVGAYPDYCFPYTLRGYGIPRDIQDDDEKRIQFKNANPLTCPNTCKYGGQVPTPTKLHSITKVGSSIPEIIAALNKGPIFVGMYTSAGTTDLYDYGCGVFTDPVPFPSKLSGLHAVEMVDYSNSSYSGTPFFVVKNSWGPLWGERGYFRIAQNSKLFIVPVTSPPGHYFYSFNIGTGSSSQRLSLPSSPGMCTPARVNVTENELVNDSIAFAVDEINSLRLITCLDGSGTAIVRQTSVINATEQVVAGMITDIALRVAVTGCEEEAATLRVVVLQNMNDSFSLLDISYSHATLTHSHSVGLILALLGLICGLILP